MKPCEVIRNRRKELGYSMQELGDMCGVSSATVARWESGEIRKIKMPTMKLLASALNMDVLDIITTDEVLTQEERYIMNGYRSVTGAGKAYIIQQVSVALQMFPITQRKSEEK